jgi:hypothetical protein
MRTVSDQTWFIRMSQATRVLSKTFPASQQHPFSMTPKNLSIRLNVRA